MSIDPIYTCVPTPCLDDVISLELSPEELLREIKNLSLRISQSHKEFLSTIPANSPSLERHSRTPHEFGVTISQVKSSNYSSINARLEDPKFWRRRIFKLITERIHHLSFIRKEMGHNTDQQCCPKQLIELIEHKEKKNLELLDRKLLVKISNGKISGNTFSLGELSRISKKKRKNEIFIIIKAIEKIATMKGHTWAFITFTCPPEYHPNPSSGLNSYDESLKFKDAADYLNKKLFYQFQKRLDKKFKRSEDYAGLKVLEVHIDGCPHLHFLIFFRPEMKSEITKVIKNLYNADRPEWYFAAHESDIIRFEDRQLENCAKASSYIYRYLDPVANELSTKYSHALKASGVRQFSFFGIAGCQTKKRLIQRAQSNIHSYETRAIEQMASELFVSKEIEDRNDRQLSACIAFITEGSKSVELVKESCTNKYGETSTRVIGVKHADDSKPVITSGRCEPISPSEANALCNDSEVIHSSAQDAITARHAAKVAARGDNYT
ncbi:replication endonuclease [Pseudomonas aeruginosa]